MILSQHRAPTGTGIHPVTGAGSCTLSWRKNPSVTAGDLVGSIRVRVVAFERAEDPM